MKSIPRSLFGAIIFLITASQGEEIWNRHAIDRPDSKAGRKGADGVRLGDLNKDGLLDIVTGWEEGSAVRVCLNPGPEAARNPWTGITVGRVRSTEDAVFADLDGDGRTDVVSSAEGSTRTVFAHWAPVADQDLTDETLWQTTAFPKTANQQLWMFCYPHDLDHDGDLDLFLGSKGNNASISWLENPGHGSARAVETWKLHRIHNAAWIMTLTVFQSEGRKYLLASDRKGSNAGIYLFPLLDESPWIGKAKLIGASGEEVMFVDVAHLDDDEKLDIIASIKPNQTRVYYQPETALSPWIDVSDLDPFPQDRYGTAKAVKVADLTGDRIPDFVISCENAQGGKHGVFTSNVFSEISEISGTEGAKFDRLELLDLDDDGDLDVITCEERQQLGVFWYENPLY
jgi:hypothetical protein